MEEFNNRLKQVKQQARTPNHLHDVTKANADTFPIT